MELVVDTNVVFSLFKKDSFTNDLIKEHNIRLVSPDWLIKELDKYAEVICSKSIISMESYKIAKEQLLKVVDVKNPSKEFLSKAEKLISDKKDAPFLALALELNIPVWSNDPHFKEFSVKEFSKSFTTTELSEYLEGFSPT